MVPEVERSPSSLRSDSHLGHLRPPRNEMESTIASTSSGMTASSPSTSSSSSSSSLTVSRGTATFSGAPTPFNTIIEPGADSFATSQPFDEASTTSRPSGSRRHYDESNVESSTAGMEMMYDQGSLDPAMLSSLGTGMGETPMSDHPSFISSRSRQASSLSASTRSASHLLPYTPPIRDPHIRTFIPHSERPIPLPPQAVRSSSSVPGEQSKVAYTPPLHSPGADANAPADRGSLGIVDPSTQSTSSSIASKLMGSAVDKRAQEDRDALRLQQLGYDAVLGRDYTFWSSLAISWLNIGCIQGTIYAVSGAYSFGGPLMILVMWPLSGVWTIFLTLSLSELASAYPVSGAMASWAWKVARGGVGGERWWAWLMGGVVLGGHVASALLVTWQLVNIIHGIMSLSFDYQYQSWHSILFFLTVLLVCGVVGSQAWGRSHRFWIGAGMYGFAVWLILCVSLLATGARHSHSISPNLFMNNTGWSSRAYVFILGWEYCTIASGNDASAHMAEETQNPSRNVPNAMVTSMALTYILGMVSITLLLLSVDPQDAATIGDHSFAVGYILTQAINRQAAIGICCLLIFTLTVQIMAQIQASARFVFALARDNAMPFAEQIRWTNASKQPVVAHWLVIALCAPFSCLVVAGRGPLYSVLAVTASTLSYLGYITPVLLYLFSGKDLQSEGRSSWSLRSRSKIIGTVGVAYGIAVIGLSMAPGSYPVTIDNISWSPIILVGTVIVCCITWYFYGAKHYSGPIKAVTKWETGVEIDLQSAIASQRSKPSGPNPQSTSSGSKPPHPRHTPRAQARHLHHVPDLPSGAGPGVSGGSDHSDEIKEDYAAGVPDRPPEASVVVMGAQTLSGVESWAGEGMVLEVPAQGGYNPGGWDGVPRSGAVYGVNTDVGTGTGTGTGTEWTDATESRVSDGTGSTVTRATESRIV